ncbi:MAG: hypothetical protein ACI3VA_10115 [Candidatus Limivicinus sp.]
MSKYFNEQMSSYEARTAFFMAIEGKTKEEIEEIKKEYKEVLSVILDREFKLVDQGWIID